MTKAPEGSTRMRNIFENNSKDAISVRMSVNGHDERTLEIPAKGSAECLHSLPGDGRIKVFIKGDRRTVLLRTEFE